MKKLSNKGLSLSSAGLVWAGLSMPAFAFAQAVTVQTGVPLHVALTRTAAMRVGAPVEGVLTDPVWVYDRMIWPKGSVVRGTVASLAPMKGEDRLKARLNGDLTPLHMPVVRITSVEADGNRTMLDAQGGERQTETVRFLGPQKRGMRATVSGLVQEKWASVHDQVLAPGKKDRVLRMIYNQLPYHPQRVWQGTEFVADLQQPASVAMDEEPEAKLVDPAELAGSMPKDATVHARLLTALDSDTTKQGTPVTALVTEPVYGINKELVLPEGSQLQGSVLRVKQSKSFGRNGALRFTFKDVQRQDEDAQKLRGTVTGAQGAAAANLQVDDEGNVKAQPAKNRFAAPLLLAVLAAGGHDEDGGVGQQVVAANGVGLVGRIVSGAVASPNVAAGFGMYGLAKSIYFRFVRRGQPVTFPKDTAVEVAFGGR